MLIAELVVAAVVFGAAPPSPITVTPVDVPPGVEIVIDFPAVQEPWPAGWICAVEPATQPGTIARACADPEQIRADYPPPYFTPGGEPISAALVETAG